MYGFETRSLTLREEHRLRVFGNKMRRRIFGPRRDEILGIWRKLHNKELHNLNSSPNIIRIIKSEIMRVAGHVARMGSKKVHTDFWWGKHKERYHYEDLDIYIR
jgi:hypothetical protein